MTSGGQTIFQLDARVPEAGQPLTILVPTHNLHPGAFELTMFGVGAGGQREEKISVFRFDLRFHP